jgi:uncharacterized membrane protein YeaQ/YmgE (transglycosylase-associated protein family)
MSFLEISLQNFILWTMAGIAIGYYADQYDKKKVAGGVVLTAFFAVLGALMTGYLMSFISGKGMLQFSLQGFLVAVLGAFFIAFFYRFSFSKNSKRD